jgi:hypothetical protein
MNAEKRGPELCTKIREPACGAVSEPRAVGTGPRLNLNSCIFNFNETNQDSLSGWPVAACFQNYKRLRRLTPALVWQPNDRNFLHRRMPQQNSFNFDSRNVFAAADNYILNSIAGEQRTRPRINADTRESEKVMPSCLPRSDLILF